MAEETTVDPTQTAATEVAEDGKAKSNNRKNGKRRLSKRERKNLKKQKTANNSNANTITTSTTTTQPTLEEYLADYIPAPSVKIAKETADSKSLGKWFPSASVIKSQVSYGNDYLAKLAKQTKKLQSNNTTTIHEPKASLVLFYQYVQPTWSTHKVSSFLTYLTNIAQSHRTNIGGRIRVSTEGINATVSAASFPPSNTTNNSGTNNKDTDNNNNNNSVNAEFEAAKTLRHFTQDLQQFDPEAFQHTDFKYIDGLTADRHFKEMKLLPVKELVFYGLREGDCATSFTSLTGDNGGNDAAAGSNKEGESGGNKEVKGGVHLDAKDYHEMLKRNDAVVIDVRNHYEAAIGRFDGQMQSEQSSSNNSSSDEQHGGGGATYIDPKMRKSTDFTSWLAEEETRQKLQGKTVMMFCTGGIRCERASAYLNSQIGTKVNGVYQLKGGIERYLKEFPDGGFWRGKNFVFDKREAISAGNVNGDGGVIKSGKKDGKGTKLEWGTECAKCKKPWDRYVGKRKCFTCGVPVLVCNDCMSQSSSTTKKKKKKDAATADDCNNNIRCPLCVAEGVTVPAEDVEWTDNGVRGRTRTSSFSEGGGEAAADEKSPTDSVTKQSESKAAKSVLKWGGGHAKKKKDKRNWSRRLCQFGADCVRKDCFFYHPERELGCKKA